MYRRATFADATRRAYRTHRKTYLSFCNLAKVTPIPATTSHLCLYAAYLARFLVPQSIVCYLNFVGLLHKEAGLGNPFDNNWTLQSVMSGIKRMKSVAPTPRLPMTPQILLAIRGRLNLAHSYHASFWAICLTAFFGLFRKAHLLPTSGKTFDCSKHFTRMDFQRHEHQYIVHVRWSKTIQFQERTLHIPLVACPTSPLCPVAAIDHALMFTLSRPPHSQVFGYTSPRGTFHHFTYKRFMRSLHKVLTELGISSGQFGSHSFRRGGASLALEAGVPLDTISIMGDWKSDSMFLYLHMPLSQRLAAQHTIVSHLQSYA